MAHSLARFDGASAPAAAPANSDDVTIAHASSGNVFADLGFENPAEEQLKADLVIGITDEIARRGLSQTAAAKLMGISQPDASKLLRGRTGGYSLERLLAFTRAFGSDVEITVRRPDPDPASARPGRVKLLVLESV